VKYVDIVFTIRTYTTLFKVALSFPINQHTYTTLFKVALSFPINQHTYTIISVSYEGIRIEFK